MEDKISKVAICPICEGLIKACHVGYLTVHSQNEFLSLRKEGFTILLETAEETRAREMTPYDECWAALQGKLIMPTSDPELKSWISIK